MVQTVPGGSADAVHREVHQNSCLDTDPDSNGSNDSEQAPQAQVMWKSRAIPKNQLIDRAENDPSVTETSAAHPGDSVRRLLRGRKRST